MLASVSGTSRRNVVPLPGVAFDADRAFQFFESGLHHVQPHAAAGNLGDLVCRAESRREDQVVSASVFVQPRRIVPASECRARLRDARFSRRRVRGRRLTLRSPPDRLRGTRPGESCRAQVLPAARRSAADSMPWSAALRTRCASGSASAVENALIEIRVLSAIAQHDRPCCAAWPHRERCAGSGGKAAPPAPCGSSSPTFATR